MTITHTYAHARTHTHTNIYIYIRVTHSSHKTACLSITETNFLVLCREVHAVRS